MIIHGDSLEELAKLQANSIDAVVTDPPYGLGNTSPSMVADCLRAWSAGETWRPSGSGFMSKAWDAWVPPPELWREVLRVLKPGGHALVFAGSRTQDLMGMSLRLAGFEVRDVLQWIYGEGFPKSHNISKAIDRAAGANREVIGTQTLTGTARQGANGEGNGCKQAGLSIERVPTTIQLTAPATQAAKKWDGWGTGLKPAYEPCLLLRKPLDGSVVNNVLEHGTGGLNIDGCRLATGEDLARLSTVSSTFLKCSHVGNNAHIRQASGLESLGRWPSNVLFDQPASELLGRQSRFFYCAKASFKEREAGLIGENRANIHPTVKPLELMKYLCRLITPPGGTLLDPFTGSGSTLCAAALEGFNYIGIEQELEYVNIAKARVAYWSGQPLDYEPELKQSTTEPREVQLSLF